MVGVDLVLFWVEKGRYYVLVLYGSILIRVIDFEFVKLLEILEFLVSFIWFFI